MKGKRAILILVGVLLVAGGAVWYSRKKADDGKVPTSAQSTATLSPATSNGLDIPALEKELGIEIKEIPAPTSTIDTSGWKTYRNEEYGFEVKYPGGYRESRSEFSMPIETAPLFKSFYIYAPAETPRGTGSFFISAGPGSIAESLRGFPIGERRGCIDAFEYFIFKGRSTMRVSCAGFSDNHVFFVRLDSRLILGINSYGETTQIIGDIFSTLTFF